MLYGRKITKFVFHYFIWYDSIIQLCINYVTFCRSNDLSEFINPILNSTFVVKETKVIEMEASTTRKRRAFRLLLRVKLKLDNHGYTSNCFPTRKAAARILAANKSKNQSNFPFNVESVNGKMILWDLVRLN